MKKNKFDLFGAIEGGYGKSSFKVAEGIELEINPFDSEVSLFVFDENIGKSFKALKFPHVTTIGAFEGLFWSLTGKNIGDD